MSIAMPDAEVRGYEHLVDRLDLPDPDDRHVLATALASGAGLIVTANGADFPAARTTPHGIVVRSPDEFVLQLTRPTSTRSSASSSSRRRRCDTLR